MVKKEDFVGNTAKYQVNKLSNPKSTSVRRNSCPVLHCCRVPNDHNNSFTYKLG